MIIPFYKSINHDYTLVKGDCKEVLKQFDFKFDMIFADPPYFLSNGGFSISNGKIVCVDKGDWDKGGTPDFINQFNKEWISLCKDKLADDGTIWISGTYHNIFSVATQLSELGFKIMNVVTWAKDSPPDNFSHRVLTHASEFIIWAKKSKRAYHKYNYDFMKLLNNGKQMTDVWNLPSVSKWEKSCGKHPTQKPLSLLGRIILASTKENDWILDPFCGSGTTGIAASILGRRFLGIDKEESYLDLSIRRRMELDFTDVKEAYQEKILSECHSSCQSEKPKMVLVGRVSSLEHWEWIQRNMCYNLPVSKIISMPKLLGAEFVLLLNRFEQGNACLYKVSQLRPQIRSISQISKMSGYKYLPKRDNSYWIIHLINQNESDLSKKIFYKRELLTENEERGAYWLKPIDQVLKAFK